MRSQSGRAVNDLLQFLVLVIVVPPIVCCALQAAVMVIGMVLPGLVVLAIALGVAGALGAGFAVKRRVPPPREMDLAARVPPVRRPPGIADRRHR